MDLEIENENMNNSYSLNTFDIDFKTLLETTLKIEKVGKSNDTNLKENNLVQDTCCCPKGIVSTSVEKYRTYVDDKYENNFGDSVSQYDNCNSSNAKNFPEQEMYSDKVSSRQKDLFEKMKELILPRLFLAFSRYMESECTRKGKREGDDDKEGENMVQRVNNIIHKGDGNDNDNNNYDDNNNNNYNDIHNDNINLDSNCSSNSEKNLNNCNSSIKINKNENKYEFEIIESSSQNFTKKKIFFNLQNKICKKFEKREESITRNFVILHRSRISSF